MNFYCTVSIQNTPFRIFLILSVLLSLNACDKGCYKKPSPLSETNTTKDLEDAKKDVQHDMQSYENRLKNNWDSLREKIHKQWDKLTEEDLSEIKGSYHKLSEKLRSKYYKTKEEADRMIQEFFEKHP